MVLGHCAPTQRQIQGELVNTHQLRWLATKASKRHNKWFAALEQSGLSACNFLYSLLVVKFAGVVALGTYSFWFVVCQFMAMLAMGLATRQMVLQFSNETIVEQHRAIWATCRIVAILQLVLAVLIGAVLWFYPPANGSYKLWVALTLYSACVNFAELFRQFYYLRSRQRLSLWFSALSLTVGAAGFAAVALSGVVVAIELYAFWFLALGNLVYIVLAYSALRGNAQFGALSRLSVVELFRSYWKSGLPGTSGMLVTWLQNQSVTPLLMFMLGPLAVGYYSVERMIVTPVNMVSLPNQHENRLRLCRSHWRWVVNWLLGWLDRGWEFAATTICSHCHCSLAFC